MNATPQTVIGSPRAWLGVIAAIFGTFMAILDISITNASLPQIQGEIGATGTEGTWIGTSYLVAEIIMVPLTAWFTRLLGMRAFLLMAGVGFTVTSVICGFSGNLTQMILGRLGQGFFGGAMIPASFTIIATRLLPKQQPIGLAIYVAAVVIAPVIGPVVGGWLTDTLSWHWLFFMNLPIGIALVALVFVGMDRETPNWHYVREADWAGILGLGMFLGALTVVLEEGQRENWFDSPLIIRLTLISAVGAVLVVITQFTHAHPVVRLRVIMSKGLPAVFGITLFVGASMFITMYTVPVFLGTIAGYSASQVGFVVMYGGISAFILTPVIMILMNKVDLRWIIFSGLAVFSIGSFATMNLTPDSVGADFILTQLAFGAGQIACGMPLVQASTVGLKLEDVPDSSALFSMARNLGGSVGLALTGVLVDRRSTFHMDQLAQVHTANSAAAQERIAIMTGGFLRAGSDTAYAGLQAMRLIAGEIQRQALVMSYADGFWIMGIVMACGLPLVLLMNKGKGGGAVAAH